MSRNSLNVTGSGIRAGIDGLRIDGNRIVNTDSGAARRVRSEVGIALATGLDRDGPGSCQILGNQITGFSLAGILIGAPTRDLIVSSNIVESCGNGILSGDDANGGGVSIENNHLRNIGREGATSVIGIGVVRAESTTIAGNTIRTLAVQTVQSTLTAAILTFGVQRPRVTGNEVTEVAPPGDFVGMVVPQRGSEPLPFTAHQDRNLHIVSMTSGLVESWELERSFEIETDGAQRRSVATRSLRDSVSDGPQLSTVLFYHSPKPRFSLTFMAPTAN